MTISLDDGLTLQLGEHSYIHDQKIRNPSGALTHITIGKFCSIATDLTVIGYDHHHEWITTYPFLDDAHRTVWPGARGIPYPQAPQFGSNRSRGAIAIGNDVWIGYNVKLFKGITIGDGAVIGACSLVNKSVEPYTIVAGTPARPIRKRFADAEIAALERIGWWDWPPELINQYLPFLCSSRISDLEKYLTQDPEIQRLKAGSANMVRMEPACSDRPAIFNSVETPAPCLPALPVSTAPLRNGHGCAPVAANNGTRLNPSTAALAVPAPADPPAPTPAVSGPKQPGNPQIWKLAQYVGDDWKQQPYYDDAEQYIEKQWRETIWPFIHDADFSCVLDLAAGHGRNSEKLKQHARQIYIVDINQENIDFCRGRFAGDPRFVFLRNDGCSLEAVPSGAISLVYCFDAMVHFDSDVVRAYLREFVRVLRPGGLGFCHHSNFTKNPGGDVHNNPGWRNFMSEALFAHYCVREGLQIIKSRVIDWTAPDSDCLTLFKKI